ncbi:MAG TPA: YdcF family protein [Symbiobacteriaceae bacterium]|nr:YdcF family protein [Symbiobacteriaceae bacterium]
MKPFWKRTLLTLGALALAGVTWTAYQWYDIQRTWQTAQPSKRDAAIILGAGVWEGKPSPALRERLDVALELERQGLVRYYLCTGGVGEDPRSEASVCAEYLKAHGVPPGKILLEEASTSTRENLANARPILEQHGLKTALVVTHGFHTKRALLQAADLGLDAAAAPVRIRPVNEKYLVFREVAAITYYELGGRARVGIFRWSVADR